MSQFATSRNNVTVPRTNLATVREKAIFLVVVLLVVGSFFIVPCVRLRVHKLLPGVVACAIMLGLIWCAIMVLQRGGFCRVSSASLSGYSEYMRIEAKTKD